MSAVTPELAALFQPTASPPPSFVPQTEAERARLRVSVAVVQEGDRDRRLGLRISLLSPWITTAILAVALGYALSIIKNRPVAQDKVSIAILHENGAVDAPVMADAITPTQRELAITQFVYDYAHWRLEYTWEHALANLNNAKMTSSPGEQAAYLDFMLKSPQRPDVTLGKGGTASLDDSRVHVDRDGPAAFVVLAARVVHLPNGIRKEEHIRMVVSYTDAPKMPSSVAAKIDPLKILITRCTIGNAEFDPNAAPLVGVPTS